MKLRPERKSFSTGFHGFRKVPSEGLPHLVLCPDSELADMSRQQRRSLRRNHGGEGESARNMRRRLKRYRRGTPMRPSLLEGVKYFNAWARGDRAGALLHAVPVSFTPEKSFHAVCGAKMSKYERAAFDPTESRTCADCRRETTGLHLPVGA